MHNENHSSSIGGTMNPADLEVLREAIDHSLRVRVARLLAASRWRAPRHWSKVVAYFSPERKAILPRAALAAEFQAAGLLAAAHEVMARKVGPGEVLTYGVTDSEALAGAAFVVVPITLAAIRRAEERRRARVASRA
jgi:hypothetical protein